MEESEITFQRGRKRQTVIVVLVVVVRVVGVVVSLTSLN